MEKLSTVFTFSSCMAAFQLAMDLKLCLEEDTVNKKSRPSIEEPVENQQAARDNNKSRSQTVH